MILSLLQSRRFWVALVTLFIIIVAAFIPNFTLDTEEFVSLLLIAVGYIVSLVIDPGDPKAKWSSLLKSRKFWTAVVSMLIILVKSFGGVLPPEFGLEQMVGLAVVAGGLIVSWGIEGKYKGELDALIK